MEQVNVHNKEKSIIKEICRKLKQNRIEKDQSKLKKPWPGG